MSLSVFSGDHHYIRISFQCNEYSDQYPVKAGERPLRMEIESHLFFKIRQRLAKPDVQLFASCHTSSSTMHCMVARSIQSGHGCNATKLVEESYCVRFPLWSDKPCTAKKYKGGSNRRNDSLSPT